MQTAVSMKRKDEVYNGFAKINEFLAASGIQFFGASDWFRFYHVMLTPEQAAIACEFPWGEDVLMSSCPFYPGRLIRDTHVAILAVENFNLVEFPRPNPFAHELRLQDYRMWYMDEEFAYHRPRTRWHLLLKNIVPASERRDFLKQWMMLPEPYEVPSAIVEATKVVASNKKFREIVNEYRHARTADCDRVGRHVCIHGSRHSDIDIRNQCFSSIDIVGLAAERKPGC